jgi:radical SAM superfamily enzyme YgiQ (UPF0313 family)
MNHDAVDALARSGCREVWLGAESGSQRVIDAMDKGITVADIRGARRRLGDRGLRARFFIQFGSPGETWANRSVLRTREPAERNLRPTRLRIPVSVLAEPPHVEPAMIR